ncbi:MAG: glucose-6-phosphate isomerase [Hyphomonadaceae bacterium]|nr:glucose-6-phosphate isomerase [Hyphomonadaceae bacterium]
MSIEKLRNLASSIVKQDLPALAADSPNQPIAAAGWCADLSRHYVDPSIEAALLSHADEIGLSDAISALFSAKIVNPSEDRPALHWALRLPPESELTAAEHQTTVDALLKASEIVAAGRYSAIVHIGIGGSDFGPRLYADAFADLRSDTLDLRFCANVDPLDLDLALHGLDPATTLIIGISKSFGTEETLYNLGRARTWLEQSLDPEQAAKHLLLVTANPERATAWLDGIPATTLNMPISVGGRYSIWSAASVAVMTAFGVDTFKSFLAGAASMDQHVKSAPTESNLAARLALLDFWNTSFLGFTSRAVLAYSRRLRMLPTYLQQLEMESNGKSVGPDGAPAPLATAPLLWGGEGSVGQHSYHQWLHQGTHIVPAEFILAPGAHSDTAGVEALTAHALAQAEVMANGRSLAEVKSEEPHLADHIARQKVHPGGRPSTFLSTREMTPERLGALIALYEHRTYLAGVLWQINSFDQWGVERGKTMATRLKPALTGREKADDPVTQRIIGQIQ